MKPRRKPAAARKPGPFPPDRVLTGYDAQQLRALGRELEQYRFEGCDFNGADLTNLRFEDCTFDRCNLSTAQLRGTALQNVAFADCKLLGVAFSVCQEMLFAVHFDDCLLRYATFGGKRMAGTRFERCSLTEADFTNTDLTGGAFAGCDLVNAVFHETNLTAADFTTAHGFSINPEINVLTGARLALAGLPGLLERYGLVVE